MRKSSSQRARRNREKRLEAEQQQVALADQPPTGIRDAQERISRLKRFSDIANLVQSLLTIAGIIAAGIWFIAQSESSYKANITHSITHRKIHKDWIWIHASIEISNVGKRRIDLRYGELKLYQILPLDITVHDKINKGSLLVSNDDMIVDWTTLNETSTTLKNNIYPGETDRIYYEFIVPSFTETVELYTYFSAEKADPQGWFKATVYDLHKKEASAP